jgi:hypothetical protein
MASIFEIASIVLYFVVAVICLVMAYTTISAKKFLPFHEQGAGVKWGELGLGLQTTILTLLRLSGLGFLVVGLILLALPALNHFDRSLVLSLSVPVLAFVFCSGLCLFNYQLHKKTQADTPWKGSIFAMAILAVAFILSILGR